MVKHQGKVLRGYAPATLRSVSMKTIQEMIEIFLFVEINGQISEFDCNG